MWDKVAHLFAALTIRMVVPKGLGEVTVRTLERHELLIFGKRFAMVLDELGVKIKGIHVA